MFVVPFDSVFMVDVVSKIVSTVGWKLRNLMRTLRFYTTYDLVGLYKRAIYHATRTVICRPDVVQPRFLKDIGVDEATALSSFHLIPFSARRDIAM